MLMGVAPGRGWCQARPDDRASVWDDGRAAHAHRRGYCEPHSRQVVALRWTGFAAAGADPQAGLEFDHRLRGCTEGDLSGRVRARTGTAAGVALFPSSGRLAFERSGAAHLLQPGQVVVVHVRGPCVGITPRRARTGARGRPGRIRHRDHPPAVGTLARLRAILRTNLQPAAARAVEPEITVFRLADSPSDPAILSRRNRIASRTADSRSARTA
jgi:hypothetical protein